MDDNKNSIGEFCLIANGKYLFSSDIVYYAE